MLPTDDEIYQGNRFSLWGEGEKRLPFRSSKSGLLVDGTRGRNGWIAIPRRT